MSANLYCFNALTTEKTTGTSSSAEDESRRIKGDTEKSSTIEKESCFDVCESLNIDRLEVLWCIAPPSDEDEAVDEKVLTPDLMGAHTTEKRWWGATLLPLEVPSRYYTFSGEEDDSESSYVAVPIRHLLYDSYVEGGFLETSLNEVAFISDRLVYDIELGDHLVFRREGSTWEPSDEDATADSTTADADIEIVNSADNARDSLLPVLESVLSAVLEKYQSKMALLTAERQHWIADCVVRAKERLADIIAVEMEKNGSNVITADLVKICMEEVGKSINNNI